MAWRPAGTATVRPVGAAPGATPALPVNERKVTKGALWRGEQTHVVPTSDKHKTRLRGGPENAGSDRVCGAPAAGRPLPGLFPHLLPAGALGGGVYLTGGIARGGAAAACWVAPPPPLAFWKVQRRPPQRSLLPWRHGRCGDGAGRSGGCAGRIRASPVAPHSSCDPRLCRYWGGRRTVPHPVRLCRGPTMGGGGACILGFRVGRSGLAGFSQHCPRRAHSLKGGFLSCGRLTPPPLPPP